MKSDKQEQALKIFVSKVKNKLRGHVVKIIVFGSYARGEAGPESDIDILVLTRGADKDRGLKRSASDLAMDILLDTGIYISAKVVTEEEYSFMKQLNTGFYQNISKEGVAVG